MYKANKKGSKGIKDEPKHEFEEIFHQSPIGIILCNKEGKITNINNSALQILGVPKLDDILRLNLFDYSLIAEKKEELINKGIIRFQAPFDLELFIDYGYYNPNKKNVLFLDNIVSVIDSGFLVQIQDITELKETERGLKLKEMAIKSSISPFAILNPKGHIIYANDSCLRLWGYESGEVLHRSASEFWHNREQIKEIIEAIEKEGSWRGEILSERKDGSAFYTELYASMVFDDKREPIGIVCSIININERKRIEKELKDSEKKLKDIIHGSPVLTFVIDKDHRVLYWNKAIEEYSGVTAEEVIGTKNHWKAFYEEKRPLLIDLVIEDKFEDISSWYPSYSAKSEIVKGAYEVEGFFPTMGILPAMGKKGRWLRGTASTINDSEGKIVGAVEILEDITERKKAEEELHKAQDILEEEVKKQTLELQIEKDKLNNIINSTKSGVYLVNSNYELEYVNPVIEKDFGLIKGQKCYEYFYNEHDICSECKIQKAFEGNVIEWEQHLYRLDKVFDALATPLINSDGSSSVIVFLYDVTRRENAEKYLKEVIDELKRSNEELERFAYVAYHDLQEPLRTVASFTQLLERRYKGKFDSDADEFMDFIVEAAIRMKKQIEGLLEYSRIETKGEEFKPVNTNDILNRVINYLRVSIEEFNAKITYDELPVVMGDPGQLQRVFQNLISNALKFRKEDESPKIHISASKDEENNEYIFSVSDNGIGIEEQYMERIFVIFQRLHTRDEYKGTGIGLSIVKRIIERHEGHIWVKSEYGKGSTFYFTLPFDIVENWECIP